MDAVAQTIEGKATNAALATSVEIAVPPYAGLEPELSLAYHSGSDDGFVGVGWTLTGQSYIERASPGAGAPAYRSTDVMLLDGEPLVPCTVLGGTHCTRRQRYQRITRDAGMDRWYVWRKDGTRSTYVPLYVTSAGTFRWALQTEQDTNGNVVNYDYWVDAGHNAYLDTIRYGGVVIKLWREGRTDDVSFANGVDVGQTRYRLKTIDVTVGGSRARAYRLDYAYSPSTGRTLLGKVTRYGTDARLDTSGTVIGGTALPAQTFTYTPGAAGYGGQSWNGSIGGWDPTWKYLFGDINGDGFADEVTIYRGADGGAANAQVAHSNGAGFPFVAFNDTIGGWSDATEDVLVDVNGDGRADLVRIYQHPSGDAFAQVNPSDGNGFPSQSFNGSVGGGATSIENLFADVDGDGRADLVRIYQHRSGDAFAQVNPSDGRGFPSQSFNGSVGGWDASAKQYLADINGDGRADLVRIYLHPSGQAFALVSLSDGTGFPAQSGNTPVGGWEPSLRDYLADVNGDGKADLVRVYHNGANAFAQINLSNGHSFATASWNSSIGGWDPSLIHDYFVDVNGDHRADSVRIYRNGDQAFAQVRPYDGVGYSTDSFNGAVGGWDPSRIRDNFVDVNGDGKADLVRVYNQGTGLFDARAQVDLSPGGAFPDLLATYSNGLGAKLLIDYVPSTHWDSTYLPAGMVIPTVASIQTDDGRGASNIASYFYLGALWSDDTRELLGFAYERTVLDAQGTTRETFYRQSIANSGAPADIYLKDARGAAYYHIHNTYSENNTAAPYTARLTTVQSYVFNQTGAKNELHTDYAYDIYGNVTQTIEYGYYAEWFDERTQLDRYAYNTDAYIVGLKSASSTHAGTEATTSTKTAEARYYYDRATATVPPARGNLTRTELWDNKSGRYVVGNEFDYDSFGNVARSTDARGKTTTYDYDPIYHRFVVQVTNALGHRVMTSWNTVLGVPATVTDDNGGVTQTGYDVLGQKVSVVDPLGHETRWQYVDVGHPNLQRIRITRPDGTADGLWSEAYFDGLGRTVRVAREGASSGTSYLQDTVYSDATDRPQKTSLWYAAGGVPRWTSFAYDGTGRRIRTTLPDGSVSTVAYTNSFFGKTNAIATDPLGHQTSTFYDAYGRPQQVYEINGAAQYLTTYQYDTAGHLIERIDARNNVTSYVYDSLGQKISMADPDVGTVTYLRDDAGLLLGQFDAKHQSIGYTYDALGRPATKLVNGVLDTTWFYDEAGHGSSTGMLTRVVDPLGGESHSWNALGLESSTTRTIGAVSRTVARTYDAIGRLATLTYPGGEVVTYGYDLAGGLNAMTSSSGLRYVSDMKWSPAGQLTSMTYGNGTVTGYIYDPDRAWLATAQVKRGTTALYDASYTYFRNGLVSTTMQDTKPVAKTLSYAYDDLGRLRSVTGAQNQTFTYDEIGNVTSNSRIGTYGYGDPKHRHAVTAAGSALAYSYDDNGNRISGDGKTYLWDPEDRLVSVTAGPTTTSFGYDTRGNRLVKSRGASATLYFGTTVEQVNGADVQYYYAGPVLVARRDLATGTRTWYHADRLGSIRLLTSDQGIEVKDYDYQPFGKLDSTSGTASNERGFAGQIADDEDDLIYMRSRHYDAKLGSFVSPDSISPSSGNPQDENGYSYCANNPVNNTDPTGHAPIGPLLPPTPPIGPLLPPPIRPLLPPSTEDRAHYAADRLGASVKGAAKKLLARQRERALDIAAAAKVKTLNGMAGESDTVIRLPANITVKSDDLTFDLNTGIWTRTLVLSNDATITIRLASANYDGRVRKDGDSWILDLGGAPKDAIVKKGDGQLKLSTLILDKSFQEFLGLPIEAEHRARSAMRGVRPGWVAWAAPVLLASPIFMPLGVAAMDKHAALAGVDDGGMMLLGGIQLSDGAVAVNPEAAAALFAIGFLHGYYKALASER